jgi:hypothetical protein
MQRQKSEIPVTEKEPSSTSRRRERLEEARTRKGRFAGGIQHALPIVQVDAIAVEGRDDSKVLSFVRTSMRETGTL